MTADRLEVESLGRFIMNKDHLQRNIADTKLDYLSTREFRTGFFKHTVEVKIAVRTAALWEGARRQGLLVEALGNGILGKRKWNQNNSRKNSSETIT